MVTRAIERAQTTVEQKNAEVRKDTLKYDEVRNEQRKEIYDFRNQLIDGEDLREHTLAILGERIDALVHSCCPNDYVEEWDLERLVSELTQYYPTEFSVEDLEQAESVEQLLESVLADATEAYEAHEESFPGGAETARHVERQLMLQIIDQRWRLHLTELDHLLDGIGLRGIAQTDPYVAWQREAFAMFGQLKEGIEDDYLRYVMHVQLVQAEQAPDFEQASFEAAEDPVATLADDAKAAAALPGAPARGREPGEDAAGDADERAAVGAEELEVAERGVRARGVGAREVEERGVAEREVEAGSAAGAGDAAAGGAGAALPGGAAGLAAPRPAPADAGSPAARPPGRPVQAAGPSQAARAAQAARPATPARAAQQARPGQAARPAQPARPVQPPRGQATQGRPVPGSTAGQPGAPKLGRNEPCWCGSGRKFKLCHGAG